MAKNSKQTSKRVASKASSILRDGRYGSKAKSVAGSALAQTKKGRQVPKRTSNSFINSTLQIKGWVLENSLTKQ